MRRKNGARKKKRIWPVIILLIVLCVAGFALSRNLTGKEGTKMQMYRVERGTIETYKSFSATLNVENSETISNTEGVTTIKELYVQAGQIVNKGDPLVMLGTGKVYEASITGTVNEMRFKKGDFIWPNVTLVQVSDLEHLEIQIQVDEYDVKKVEVGQKCYVTVVPLSMEIETTVNHVNRMSASNGRVAYYPVTAKIEVPDSVLPGMTVSVRMADERAENVLTLPLAALSFDEDGNPFVYGTNGENPQKISLETGLSDGMQIEIRSGVSEGQQIFAPVIGEEEETTSPLTKLLRQIFGTHPVYNEEKAVRGARGNAGRSGSSAEAGMTTPVPQGEDRMPGDARQNREQGQSTPAEAARDTDQSGERQRRPADSSGEGQTGEPADSSGESQTGARRTRNNGTSESRNENGSESPERARPETEERQSSEKGSSQRSGAERQRDESAEESAQ